MTKQISVGYDGSTSSTEAVWWAAAEAHARGARLRIVSCYDLTLIGTSMVGWEAPDVVNALQQQTETTLLDIRNDVVARFPGLNVTTTAVSGPVGYELEEGADPNDLVVVGASHHEGAAGFWLGSTPRFLVRHSACPVVVVRGAATRGRPDRVVVGVDGSATSRDAVTWAADEADVFQTTLHVVHGWWYPYADAFVGPSSLKDLTRVDAACVLEQAVELARERCGAEVTSELVERGPVAAILEAVHDGDLLVLGSHGRGALAAGLLGSTVNSVLDRSAVPVVVVRRHHDSS